MADIYEQHGTAFSRVSAYVITDNGEQVAKIAFKWPRLGDGRLYAYVHWLGVEMVRGFAGGGGYDKASAAASTAAEKLRPSAGITSGPRFDAFCDALEEDNGSTWDNQLIRAGFKVLQAV